MKEIGNKEYYDHITKNTNDTNITKKIKIKRHSINFRTTGVHLNITRMLTIQSHQALHMKKVVNKKYVPTI